MLGPSGCGKTTLLRQIFGNTERVGKEEGMLCCQTEQRGYVWQNPENQIVTDRVEYEIVFGMENLGMTKEEMSRRLAEMITFFGMEDLLEKDTMSLSGGEMQTLNIAAVVAMNPDILLLDEPASQLDPVAARRLYSLLYQINEELGITVVVAEQRLEDLVLYADSIYYLEEGKVKAQGKPAEVYPSCASFFPSYMKLVEKEIRESHHLLSLKEARLWFRENYREKVLDKPGQKQEKKRDALVGKDLFFRYERKEPDVLQDCSFAVPKGIITCIAGGNGSGKSTLLQILAGRLSAYRGKLKNIPESCGYLPQQPAYLFLKDTVEEEIMGNQRAREILSIFSMDNYKERNPYDLSGGEQERLALSLVLSEEKELYLLDEPTRGLDFETKHILHNLLQELKQKGKTIVVVSHDMEFMAENADYVALMFQGKMDVLTGAADFFQHNQFYTTGINRIAREVSEQIITIKDVERYAEKNGN